MYKVKNTAPLEAQSVTLRFAPVERWLGQSRLDDEFIIEINAAIIAELGDDKDKEIGQVKAVVLQKGRLLNEGWSLWGTCDEYSQELAEMCEALFDEDGDLKPKIDEIVEGNPGDICYIDQVFLEPQYRGYGIGLLAVDGLIKSLPSMEMDCFVLSPQSLSTEAEQPNAQQELTKYWKLMGFVPWVGGSTPLMGLCTKFPRPNIRNVVPHLVDRY